MHVMAVCHTMHHIHLSMLQYETLDYAETSMISTNMVQVLRDPFQSHRETLCEQNILLVVDLPLKNSFNLFHPYCCTHPMLLNQQ